MAYGSDALGGVISIRTRRVAPGSPWAARVSGTVGTGVPDRRSAIELSKGTATGGVLFAAHSRSSDDWHSPAGAVLNSGFSDLGVLARAEHRSAGGTITVGWQSDLGRDIERPRNNSSSVRSFYPTEDSHRLTAGYETRGVGGFQRVGVTGFLGRYVRVTDQDRFASATAGRAVERADVSASDFHVRGFGERLLRRARLEVGVDVNGRFGLHAVDDLIT